ncbi:MAG: zinc ribbon domain-containing protein [Clostridia bacterium]|nr:zinc ribbon domain-containing protein [Clostridia bacterium]
MAEVARLNSLVADEERNSEALYREIGKLYVKLHQNDCEEQFASLIDSVRKSNNTVLALKKQINDIKKVSDCPNCGASVPVNAAFCSVCGNKIEAKSSSQSSSSLKCSKCGKEVKAGSKFCMECGNKIEPEDNAVVEKSVSSKAALPKIEKKAVDAAEQSLDMRKCPACGHMQKKDMPFCTSCGAKFENAESVKKSVEVKKASIFEKKSEKVNAVPQLSGQDSDMRKCPACGHMQKKDMPFCTGCGAKFENAESVKKSVEVKKASIFEKKSKKVNAASQPSGEDSDTRKCPVCGHLQKKELPFCTNCGANMEAKKNAENPSIQKKPEPKKTEDTVLALPTEALLKPDEYKCPVCGNIQKNSFPFCTECGAKIEISDRDSNLSSADVKGKSEEAPLANKDAGDKLSKVQEVQQVSAAAFAVSVTEVSANVAVSAVNEKAAEDDDDDEDSATVMLMPDVPLPPVIPYIVRKKTNETFRISKAICKIGRDKGVNDFVVSGNKFIGHTHCHIITRNEEYFIVDDNSMNHTFVDDIMIPPNVEVKLTHGKTIKLANEEFEFKIF